VSAGSSTAHTHLRKPQPLHPCALTPPLFFGAIAGRRGPLPLLRAPPLSPRQAFFVAAAAASRRSPLHQWLFASKLSCSRSLASSLFARLTRPAF
jgi:hypothetical protein